MIAVLGALSEAWDEVRVHKSRVVLSLVGVFLAVFAMTSVTALGLIVAQVQQEGAERRSGRPATVAVNAYDPVTGMPPDAAEWDAAVAELVDRHGITTAAASRWTTPPAFPWPRRSRGWSRRPQSGPWPGCCPRSSPSAPR